jgi:hypothetical protein
MGSRQQCRYTSQMPHIEVMLQCMGIISKQELLLHQAARNGGLLSRYTRCRRMLRLIPCEQ